MRDLPRLPFLNYMPFPGLRLSVSAPWGTWGHPLWEQLIASSCRGDSALHLPSIGKLLASTLRAQKWTVYFLIAIILADSSEGPVTDLCHGDFGEQWVAPAWAAELCCPSMAIATFVKILFLANFVLCHWRYLKLGLSSQGIVQWRDPCVHPSFPAPQELWLFRAEQRIVMLRAPSGIATLVLGLSCEKRQNAYFEQNQISACKAKSFFLLTWAPTGSQILGCVGVRHLACLV